MNKLQNFAESVHLKFIQVDETLNNQKKQLEILTNAIKDL